MLAGGWLVVVCDSPTALAPGRGGNVTLEIVNTHSDKTWDLSADDLSAAAEQLIAMVAPVLDNADEVACWTDAWANEWSLT